MPWTPASTTVARCLSSCCGSFLVREELLKMLGTDRWIQEGKMHCKEVQKNLWLCRNTARFHQYWELSTEAIHEEWTNLAEFMIMILWYKCRLIHQQLAPAAKSESLLAWLHYTYVCLWQAKDEAISIFNWQSNYYSSSMLNNGGLIWSRSKKCSCIISNTRRQLKYGTINGRCSWKMTTCGRSLSRSSWFDILSHCNDSPCCHMDLIQMNHCWLPPKTL